VDVAVRGDPVEEAVGSEEAERGYPRAGVCGCTADHDPAGWARGDLGTRGPGSQLYDRVVEIRVDRTFRAGSDPQDLGVILLGMGFVQ